jgi:hypothetical protein
MAALLMAGRHPEIWAGVSVWCPLTDLLLWHEYCLAFGGKNAHYSNQLAKAVGGNPLKDSKAAAECVKRSPVTYLQNALDVDIHICVGIQDDIIPNSHSFMAFNILANSDDRFTEKEIMEIRNTKRVPGNLLKTIKEADYGKIYMRRESNNVVITAVEGGHIFRAGSLNWLGKQQR